MVVASLATMKTAANHRRSETVRNQNIFWCPSDIAYPFKEPSVARFQDEARIHLFATYMTSIVETS